MKQSTLHVSSAKGDWNRYTFKHNGLEYNKPCIATVERMAHGWGYSHIELDNYTLCLAPLRC